MYTHYTTVKCTPTKLNFMTSFFRIFCLMFQITFVFQVRAVATNNHDCVINLLILFYLMLNSQSWRKYINGNSFGKKC